MPNQDTRSSEIFRGKVLAKNTLFNLLGQGAPIFVALVAIPRLVHLLGESRFGVLTLAWMFIGYFTLFDLGLSRALTKQVVERLGSRENEIPSVFWSTCITTFFLGVTGGLVLAGLTPWLTEVALKIPDGYQEETRFALYIIAVCVPFTITTTAFKGVLEATQKFGVISVIQAALGTFSYLGPLIFASLHPTLPAVIWTLVLARIVAWIVYFAAALRAVPILSQRVQLNWREVKNLLGFGGWITVSNLIGPLLAYADRILIGSLVSIAAVAFYSTPYEMVMKLWIIPGALISVIFPAFAASFLQSAAKTALMFDRAIKFLIILIFPISLFIVTFAHKALSIWISDVFASQSHSVLEWLGAAILINCVGFIPAVFLQAAGRPDLPAKLYAVEFPLYMVALYVLTHFFGIKGAAMAWFLRTVFDVAFLTYFSNQLLKRKNVLTFRLLSIGGILLSLYALAGNIQSLDEKIVFYSLFLLFYPLFTWFCILTKDEQQMGLDQVINLLPRAHDLRLTDQGKPMGPIRKIGIALAAYEPKVEQFRTQLSSIQSQSFHNWVCVITFDSPITEALRFELREFFGDPRFEWYENPVRLGFYKNFEAALNRVLAHEIDAVSFADQDDYWYADKLEVSRKNLEMLPTYSLVHSDMHLWPSTDATPAQALQESVWQFEKRNPDSNHFVYFLLRNTVNGAASLFDARLARAFPTVPKEVEFHDHWYASLAACLGVVKPIHIQLHAYRQHGANVVGVVPFRGLFLIPADTKWRHVRTKSREGWQKTRSLMLILQNSGVQIPLVYRVFFERNLDRGFFLFSFGLIHLNYDPPFSRACFARALGKFLSR